MKKYIKIFMIMAVCFISFIICNKSYAAELESGGTYYIESNLSEVYVLDVTGNSKEKEANIEIWENNSGRNQQFVFTRQDDGYYTIKNVNSGKYLDVARANTTNGANVVQFDYNGGDNQKWKLVYIGDGLYNIISKCNGLCLDITNGNMKNGSNVITWEKNGGRNQKFRIQNIYYSEVKDGLYKIASAKNSSFIIDVTGNSTVNCANIELWHDNGGDNQKFVIKKIGNGLYTINSAISNKYFDAENAGKYNGTNVLQYEYTNGYNQKWLIRDAGDGYFHIIARCSGLYLDIDNGKMADGTNVFTWIYNGGINQKFKLIPTEITDTGRSAQFKREHPEIRVGIDVSKYQGTIDWNAVKRDGIDYVMIRAGFRGYGSTGSLNEDPKLDEYVRGARAAGLDVGIYFFSQAKNYQEGVEEANYTLGLIRKYDITYPVAFDTEDSSSPTHTGRADNISDQDRTDAAKGFCSTIKNAGYKTLIYASPSWLKDNLYLDQLSEFDIWLAHYTGATQEDPLKRPSGYKGKYVMWQYTDSGTVNGIKGKVDCDLFYYLK